MFTSPQNTSTNVLYIAFHSFSLLLLMLQPIALSAVAQRLGPSCHTHPIHTQYQVGWRREKEGEGKKKTSDKKAQQRAKIKSIVAAAAAACPKIKLLVLLCKITAGFRSSTTTWRFHMEHSLWKKKKNKKKKMGTVLFQGNHAGCVSIHRKSCDGI